MSDNVEMRILYASEIGKHAMELFYSILAPKVQIVWSNCYGIQKQTLALL